MNTVIYHANCPDGFAAALILWLHFPGAVFIPAKYGDSFPEDAGQRVAIVDFSYPEEVLLAQAQDKFITVLDHHKTAQKDLERIIGATTTAGGALEVKFDLDHCGAYMAWCHFNPNTEIPDWVRYIEDRDMWWWRLHESREFSAALASYPRVFPIWNTILEANSISTQDQTRALALLKHQGAAILRYQNQLVADAVRNIRFGKLPGCEDVIPIVNATMLASEIGEQMRQEFLGCPYNASYRFDKIGRVQWSLRGGNGSTDCGQVAKLFGGGGHPGAAGFITNRQVLESVDWKA